jgi:hypothetical protein
MTIRKRDLDALPVATGDQFSLLAAAFRDYALAVQDEPGQVAECLIDMLGWEGDQAEWVIGVLEEGVGHLFPESPDPRAEEFRKATTVVRRKKSG